MFYIERKSDVTILKIWQNLDLGSQAAFYDAFRAVSAPDCRRVIVSLERCAYCDTAGLNVLLRMHESLGSRLTVVVPPDNNSRRAFEVCRIGSSMPVAGSMREALAGSKATVPARKRHDAKRRRFVSSQGAKYREHGATDVIF